MKSFYLLIILLLSTNAFAEARLFGDLYFEGNYLARTQNGVGFAHLRSGLRFDGLEVYGAVRGSTDTRSESSPLGQVFNDNFIFAGIGADYLVPSISGFRVRAQLGSSFNLLERSNQKEGLDFQTGLLSYHEGTFGSSEFSFENYGEALYIHRYQNMLIGNQFRVLYRRFETPSGETTWGAYPILMGVLGLDTSSVFYNRFLDLRAGVRLQARTARWVFSITPEYVTGQYMIQNHATYQDFRVLAVLYVSVFD